ncbi:putative hydro-lyase [Amycolatopsis aidingensis]|uniref:putative hydro-lyase n=1 Tax=Amycolatopsis aidingensis TaxID=2842453 RepID=UPI001C0B31BA|nr:putative hydro-lyase [Amycolatopsis aidingensis]
MSGALSPARLRQRCRSGSWTGATAGACAGYLQANLVILGERDAAGFARLCRANPTPLPLLERTEPGEYTGLRTAPGADIRTDAPAYHVHRHGLFEAEVTSIEEFWRTDFVTFLLGCSYTAEAALLAAGVRLRHVAEGVVPPMFVTDLGCEPAGGFHGPMVVSMRPIEREQLAEAVAVTGEYPLAHGGPVHIGDPAEIGIADLTTPDWGDPMVPLATEVAVFWACGVTPQAVIRAAAPELAITHAPGRMFVTDVPAAEIRGRHEFG